MWSKGRGWLVAGVHEITRPNERCLKETHGLRGTEITDEGRDTWAEIERVVHPRSSLEAIRGQAQIALDPSDLLRTFKLTSTKWKSPPFRRSPIPLPPIFSLSLFPRLLPFLHCQKLRYPWICVRLDRVLSEIRVFRETLFSYNSHQTTRRFEWTCVIAVRASMRAIRFDLAFRDFRVLCDMCCGGK